MIKETDCIKTAQGILKDNALECCGIRGVEGMKRLRATFVMTSQKLWTSDIAELIADSADKTQLMS